MDVHKSSRCIYSKQSGISFSREHVIPRAFGSFGAKTMVLTDAVCTGCNSNLGKLDEILARDTYEALLRAEKLPPRRGNKDQFEARRTFIRVPDEPRFGSYRGVRMTPDWVTRKPRPLDQVIVRDEGGRLHSFTREEMAAAGEGLFQNRPPGAIQVIGTSPSAAKELQQLAESKGARFSSEPIGVDPPPASREPTVLLEIEGLIDDAVWRGIAKIAFNYLAKIQGLAYVLDDKFDRIRTFIMGKLKERDFVRFTQQPILADETPRWKKHEMHLVLFERQGYCLRGRISLFNSFAYEVALCRDLGLVYPIKSGHAFDPIRNHVYKLAGIPRSLIIRPNPLNIIRV